MNQDKSLDASFAQRRSILARVAAPVVHTFRLPMNRLHYDTTHLLLFGAYDTSKPIPDALARPPTTASADFPNAHITHGFAVHDAKMIHVGLCSVGDDLGAIPIFGHTLSGKHNGKTGIAHEFQFLQDYASLSLLVWTARDWGTASALLGPTLIGEERGLERWQAMFRENIPTGMPGRYRVSRDPPVTA